MSVDFPLPPVWRQERHTSGGWKSLRDELTMRMAVLADSRSGNFPLFSRLIPCVKPTNIFTLGWIQHLEAPAATAAPPNSAIRYIQIFAHDDSPIAEMPVATAGLNAPPEMLPTENAPTSTVNPIASP